MQAQSLPSMIANPSGLPAGSNIPKISPLIYDPMRISEAYVETNTRFVMVSSTTSRGPSYPEVPVGYPGNTVFVAKLNGIIS